MSDYQFYKLQVSACDLVENSLLKLFWHEEKLLMNTRRGSATMQVCCLMLCDQLRHTAVHFPSCLCPFAASDTKAAVWMRRITFVFRSLSFLSVTRD